MPSIKTYTCRACGIPLLLSKRGAVEHVIRCEQSDPALRRVAQQWIDDGCPTEMKASGWGGRRRRDALADAR